MSGTQLVYGDGWEDIKDCFKVGSIGRIGRGGSRPPAPGSSRSGSSYYGEGVGAHRGGGGGCSCEDCFEDFEEFCGCGNMCSNDGTFSRKRIGLIIIFLWLFILTIICIVLGSNIAYTSGTALSNRLDDHREDQSVKHQRHKQLLDTLGAVHQRTSNRVDNVAGDVSKLEMAMKRIETKMRGELKNRLSNVRGVLLSALDKAKTDISEIRRDVENGMI